MSKSQEMVNSAKKEYNDIVKEQAREVIDYIYDGVIGSEERNKLPEAVFIQEFLPVISGEKEIDKKSNFFNIWVGVAGNASNELDVVDNTGNVLFTMPGLINTNLLKFQKRERNDTILADMAEYHNAKTFLPMVAQNELMEKLDNRFNKMMNGGTGVVENRWNTILSRYGKNTATDKVSNNIKPESETDDVTYE